MNKECSLHGCKCSWHFLCCSEHHISGKILKSWKGFRKEAQLLSGSGKARLIRKIKSANYVHLVKATTKRRYDNHLQINSRKIPRGRDFVQAEYNGILHNRINFREENITKFEC